MTKFRKPLILLVCVTISFPLLFLIFIVVKDFNPPAVLDLTIKNNKTVSVTTQNSFSVLSWNIGYCGLGKQMDFFYDGGEKVRSTRKLTLKNLEENLKFIKSLDSTDFFFFQEVDKKSKRSYFIDQEEKINNTLANHNSTFASNYKVPFVPMPLLNPMGRVHAGMMTLSRFSPIETKRISYPNIASFPENLFLLDRCLILSRFVLPSGKDLVLINTHNSYYISDSSLRMIELNIMKKIMMEEYEKGNYVVAGGDWNKFPPQFKANSTIPPNLFQKDVQSLDEQFLPADWNYAYDKNIPTNRVLKTAYIKGKTKVAVIDFFVVSPNINIDQIQTFDLGFEFADHNPVGLYFTLK